jgi:hypothetical protein
MELGKMELLGGGEEMSAGVPRGVLLPCAVTMQLKKHLAEICPPVPCDWRSIKYALVLLRAGGERRFGARA